MEIIHIFSFPDSLLIYFLIQCIFLQNFANTHKAPQNIIAMYAKYATIIRTG